MSKWMVVHVLFATVAVVFGQNAEAELKYDPSTCRGVSLANSTWPNDHGDSSRTKYTLGAGLPRHFHASDLKRIDNEEMGNAQWIYTGGKNAEFVYALGGPVNKIYVAKYDSKSLRLLQHTFLDPGLYIGGLLLHDNGHVYAVHSNKMYAFWNGDLENVTAVDIPTSLNGPLVQTNGMLVTRDGLLVVKQWAMIFEDLAMLVLRFPTIPQVIVAVYVIALTLSTFTIRNKDYRLDNILSRNIYAMFIATGLLLVAVYVVVYKMAGGHFDVTKFFSTNTVLTNYGGGGELKLIDPITLQPKASLQLVERCSFARMSLSSLPNGEDALVLLGDEYSHQYRWNPKEESLYELTEWSMRYRSRWSGSFPGTGPAVFNNTVYFTDNTFPVLLSGETYSMFSQSLTSNAKEDRKKVPLTKNNQPGFMFWSVTVSPFEGDVVVWDTHGRSVQARRANDLSLHWEIRAWQMDCITIAADRGHVYLSDYDKGVTTGINSWLGSMNHVPNVTKYLIVADTHTGEIMVNTTVFYGTGMKPSLIVPGAHNDIIMGTPTGIARFYVDTE
eukprot:CAMPEP_0185035846 /NCGR_PEP_ID=MMETSP1103-20130426/27903_1 /TAXON_ID=36769 /ORGANISM="Paraphysomonas bandaiensis, Strain Caron Lab Isolate" /LENGTH=555 /DNA_ID=CAMNT_0027573117 /DNA_START=5 /DNA_END=1672 /DNA_ORIENTATION=+